MQTKKDPVKVAAYNAKRRKENPELYQKIDRDRYANNSEREKLRNSVYHKENYGKIRSRNLVRKYGITIEEYERLHREQSGLCAICNEPEVSGKKLAVDHCHETRVVRGLLCLLCNRSLGGFKDSITLLKRALCYMEKSC